MGQHDWTKLMQAYRDAVQDLDSAVKRARRLVGKEFDDEHRRIDEAQNACDRARGALSEFLSNG